MDSSRMVALAACEIGPYDNITKKFEEEAAEYLERAVQFCLDNSLTVEDSVQNGGVGGVVKNVFQRHKRKTRCCAYPNKERTSP